MVDAHAQKEELVIISLSMVETVASPRFLSWHA
jgi:hypothetical protein